MASTYHIGRGLVLLGADERGLELEGTCRLTPGRVIRLFGIPPRPSVGRQVYLARWALVRAGHGGLHYRGYGEWLQPHRVAVDAPRPAASP